MIMRAYEVLLLVLCGLATGLICYWSYEVLGIGLTGLRAPVLLVLQNWFCWPYWSCLLVLWVLYGKVFIVRQELIEWEG